jgi:hypothetical protein
MTDTSVIGQPVGVDDHPLGVDLGVADPAMVRERHRCPFGCPIGRHSTPRHAYDPPIR